MTGDPHCRAATAPQGLQTTWPFCVELRTMILKVYGSKKHPEKPSQQSCTGAGRVLVSVHQNAGRPAVHTQVLTGSGQKVQEPTQTPADTGLPAKAPAQFNGKSFQKATPQQLSNHVQKSTLRNLPQTTHRN